MYVLGLHVYISSPLSTLPQVISDHFTSYVYIRPILVLWNVISEIKISYLCFIVNWIWTMKDLRLEITFLTYFLYYASGPIVKLLRSGAFLIPYLIMALVCGYPSFVWSR